MGPQSDMGRQMYGHAVGFAAHAQLTSDPKAKRKLLHEWTPTCGLPSLCCRSFPHSPKYRQASTKCPFFVFLRHVSGLHGIYRNWCRIPQLKLKPCATHVLATCRRTPGALRVEAVCSTLWTDRLCMPSQTDRLSTDAVSWGLFSSTPPMLYWACVELVSATARLI